MTCPRVQEYLVVNYMDQLAPLQQHLLDLEAVLGQLLSAVLRVVVLQHLL